jgi:hypothetical protein
MFVVGALSLGVAVTLAAPGQDRPGDIVPNRVWIQNRASSEAIPVVLTQSDLQRPLTVAFPAGVTVLTRPAPQAWEYQEITLPPQNPLQSLQAAGMQGWETTGLTFPSANQIVVVLKRPLRSP